ncbi:MAG: hypothetical protein GXP42_10265 [Chloroflexi bacterium]|nr:hypothetical protein [Chloroflexota bacterium]
MSATTITIPLDTEVASLYVNAPGDVQKKVQLLLRLWLRDLVMPTRSLPEIMDEISEKAQNRGLTPDILESLLNDE